MRKYHIGDIISVATGVLVSPRGIDGVYDLLNFLTGDSVYTHQIPRVCGEVEPWLKCQFPWLEKLDVSGINPDNWRAWMDKIQAEHGESLQVSVMPEDWHTRIDPVEEARAMVGDDRVIAIREEDVL